MHRITNYHLRHDRCLIPLPHRRPQQDAGGNARGDRGGGDWLAGKVQAAILRLLEVLVALLADFRAGRLAAAGAGDAGSCAPAAAGVDCGVHGNDQENQGGQRVAPSPAEAGGWSWATLLWRPWIGTRDCGTDPIGAGEHELRPALAAAHVDQFEGGGADDTSCAGEMPAEALTSALPRRAGLGRAAHQRTNSTDGAIADPSPSFGLHRDPNPQGEGERSSLSAGARCRPELPLTFPPHGEGRSRTVASRAAKSTAFRFCTVFKNPNSATLLLRMQFVSI